MYKKPCDWYRGNIYTHYVHNISITRSSFVMLFPSNKIKWYILYICKTQIDVQPLSLIDVQSSNPCPISTSETSLPQIYVLFFFFFFFLIQILQSASNSQIFALFTNAQIGVHFSKCPFLTFSNRCPMTSLTYALTLTNKSAIDLWIWKGCRFWV